MYRRCLKAKANSRPRGQEESKPLMGVTWFGIYKPGGNHPLTELQPGSDFARVFTKPLTHAATVSSSSRIFVHERVDYCIQQG